MTATPEAQRKHEYSPDYAVPPGQSLVDTLDALGMTQRELATRTGLTVQTINRIIKGRQPITQNTANKLELATGVPARLWNALEAQFREQIAKIEEDRHLEADLDWLKTIPIRELIKRDAVPDEPNKTGLLRHALAFYGVSSVKQYRELWEKMPVAARRSTAFKTHLGPTSAWIRIAERAAQKIDTAPYNKKRFTEALTTIRSLTVENPDVFVPRMQELCATAGVAVCFVPEFAKAPWHGATKWLTPTKAMILLSLRGKRDDQFWFSFFHEAAHVLNDGSRRMFVDDGKDGDPCEEAANSFASEFLIPQENRSEVASLRTKAQVRHLAHRLGIAPGIVVGQYQHLTDKFSWFNDLKRRLVWAE